MIIAQIPRSEEIRLADIQLYDILDTEPETAFDELRELAAQICNCPVSLITLIDKDRQWFKSKQGIDNDISETSRDLSFCSHAILNTDVMIVDDLSKDERFFDNPFVAGEMNVRFYAGAPIVSPTGQNLGTICVLDTKPRTLSPMQERALELLSNQVTMLLELRLKSKVIEQRSAELIKLKNQAMSHLIREQDEENLSVARELHENIAQELAAGRLYLNMAADSENNRLENIQEASNAITSALNDVKNLSYNISPTTLNQVPIRVLMEDFLYQKQETYSFTVQLKIVGDTETVDFAQSMNCAKIAESWLQVLQADNEIRHVTIRLHITNQIEICIEDDASKRFVKQREKDLISNIVYYRVVSMNGVIHFSEADTKTNRFCVTFPLMKKEQSAIVNP
ncbi:GAF domain-containing sensor histidine kinase [Lacibacter sp. H407]|uniref:GAF domain-containing sensor histidine kinase n=1 Tax=Lacibacter sp. H407 TaxID=3133423 RepID=UPI0030BBC90A